MPPIKKFNQKLHDEVDPPSRAVIIQYFAKKGIQFQSNPDKYGIDLISSFGECLELEHRTCFTESFPFPTVNIPLRKLKFFQSNPGCNYCVINNDFTKCGICPGGRIQLYLDKMYANGNDWFLKIPKEEFLWIKLTI